MRIGAKIGLISYHDSLAYNFLVTLILGLTPKLFEKCYNVRVIGLLFAWDFGILLGVFCHLFLPFLLCYHALFLCQFSTILCLLLLTLSFHVSYIS
jgi:hypothetical protein